MTRVILPLLLVLVACSDQRPYCDPDSRGADPFVLDEHWDTMQREGPAGPAGETRAPSGPSEVKQ